MNHCIDASLHDRILSARSGDQQAFEDLLEIYSPLIDAMTASFTRSSAVTDEREDLRQEACIAFCHAVDRYDLTTEQVSFGAFAKRCIRNRLISCYRKKSLRVQLDPDTDVPLVAPSDPARSVVEEEDYWNLCHRIESALSPYENRVWWLYLSGRTAREIALQLQKEERSVQNAIYRIRQKLRKTIPNP